LSRKNTKTRRTQDDAFIELEHGFMYCMDPVGAGVIIDPSTRVSLDHEVLKFLTTDNVAAVVIDFQIQKQHRSPYFQNAQTIVTNSNANAVQINPGNELKPEAHKWLKGMTNWWQTTTVPRYGHYSVMLGVYGKQQRLNHKCCRRTGLSEVDMVSQAATYLGGMHRKHTMPKVSFHVCKLHDWQKDTNKKPTSRPLLKKHLKKYKIETLFKTSSQLYFKMGPDQWKKRIKTQHKKYLKCIENSKENLQEAYEYRFCKHTEAKAGHRLMDYNSRYSNGREVGKRICIVGTKQMKKVLFKCQHHIQKVEEKCLKSMAVQLWNTMHIDVTDTRIRGKFDITKLFTMDGQRIPSAVLNRYTSKTLPARWNSKTMVMIQVALDNGAVLESPIEEKCQGEVLTVAGFNIKIDHIEWTPDSPCSEDDVL